MKINGWLSKLVSCSEDGSGAFLSEPLFGFLLSNSLEFSKLVSAVLSLGHSLSSSGEDDVEIHTENTCVEIIFDSKINMLINTESEIAYKYRKEIKSPLLIN